MSRTVGAEGLKLIKNFEGCHLTAYKCPAGVWTIGYGHTAGVYEGMTITQEQADRFLIEDCQKSANYVDNAAYVPLTDSLNENQRDALISFAYNCGAGNLKKLCKGRTLIQIAAAMLSYNKAKGKILAGLTRRRKAEQALFYKAPAGTAENKEVYKMDTIRKGSKGKAVKIWQIILGFTGDEVDGSFGSQTAAATFEFQSKAFPTEPDEWDCVVGPKTWKAGFESI